MSQHFESSPDLGNALVLHVELLLQRGKELLGKQKIEDIITGTVLFNHHSKSNFIRNVTVNLKQFFTPTQATAQVNN